MSRDSSGPPAPRDAAQLPGNHEWLRHALENLSDYAIFTLDADGRIESWNAGAERMLGYREDEILGEPVDVIFPPEAREAGAPQGEVRQALETGRAGDDRWHLRRDGSRFWASGIMTSLRNEDGQARGFLKILRDMTAAKLAQERIQARARQQTSVSEFGQLALKGIQPSALLAAAADLVCETLDSDLCEVLRLTPDGTELELAAGTGWQQGPAGHARIGAKPEESHAGHTLQSSQPVVFEDLRDEGRFRGLRPLREEGVVSGMGVVIGGRTDDRPWGVLSTFARIRREFSPDDIYFLQSVANVLANAIHRQEAEQRLQELNETLEEQVVARTLEAQRRASQLRGMTLKLSQAEERERRRLAQVLHDHLQQLLVATRMHLDNIRRRAQDPPLGAELAKAIELLDQSLESSRNLTAELSPTVLYESGLIAGLEWLARWMGENYDLRVHIRAQGTLELENEEIRALAFQSVRELLFNTVKHAGAAEASVRLEAASEDFLAITVEDAGRGFDLRRLQDAPDGAGGFGLFGIQERLDAIGGRIEIQSEPARGTRISLRVPRSSDWTEDMPAAG